MLPEDGRLHVYGVGEDGVTAFTEYGIECLKQIVADERAAARAAKPIKAIQLRPLRCSPNAYTARSPKHDRIEPIEECTRSSAG